jgi:hypothetical protein
VFVHLTPKGAHDIGLWALATHPVEATDPHGTEPRNWAYNMARECRKAGPRLGPAFIRVAARAW